MKAAVVIVFQIFFYKKVFILMIDHPIILESNEMRSIYFYTSHSNYDGVFMHPCIKVLVL